MENSSAPKLARLKLISLAIQQSVRNEKWAETQSLLSERASIIEDLKHEPNLSQSQLLEVLQINESSLELSQANASILKTKIAAQRQSKKNRRKLVSESQSSRIDQSS